MSLYAWFTLLDTVVVPDGLCLAATTPPAPAAAPLPDIRQSGFVYCVSGILNTFNPQMASSGLTVDTPPPSCTIACWTSIPTPTG